MVFSRSIFIPIGQISRVAQAGDDVGVAVEFWIDGRGPNRRVGFRELCLAIVDGILAGNDACDVDVLRDAFCGQGMVGQFHASARGEERRCIR